MSVHRLGQMGLASRSSRVAPVPWARIGSTPGALRDFTYTDAAGVVWRCAEWATAGDLILASLGLVDAAVIGAGGGGAYRAHGGAGAVRWGMFILPAGLHSIVVGTGGPQGDTLGSDGGYSALGSVLRCGGGMGGMGQNAPESTSAKAAPHGGGSGGGMQINTWLGPIPGGGAGGSGFPGSPVANGVVLTITGAPIEYGKVAAPNTPGSSGSAGAIVTENGYRGGVIIRVPA